MVSLSLVVLEQGTQKESLLWLNMPERRRSRTWGSVSDPRSTNCSHRIRQECYWYTPYPSSLAIDANSSELVKGAKHEVVIFVPEGSQTHLGGTMRLGLQPTLFQSNTGCSICSHKLYGGKSEIHEGHRHNTKS